MVANPTPRPFNVIVTLHVYQLTVEVQKKVVSSLAIGRYGRLPAVVATPVRFRFEIRIGIAVVHPAPPPSKAKRGVKSRCIASSRNFAVQIGRGKEVLSVLMTKNNAMPSRHPATPFRDFAFLPPRIHPSTICLCRDAPIAGVRHYDVRVVEPFSPAHQVGILRKPSLQPVELTILVRPATQYVHRVLKTWIVRRHVQAFSLRHEREAVRGGV